MNARRVAIVLLLVSLFELAYILRLSRPSPARPLVLQQSAVHQTLKVVEKSVTNRFDWRAVENSDYRAYIANLRAIGCPEETVRDIIIADVEKLFAERVRHAHEVPASEAKYWLPEQDQSSNFAQQQSEAAQQQLEKQKRALIRQLLGVDLFEERKKTATQPDVYDKRLSFLSPEKRQQITALIEQFSEREQTIRDRLAKDGTASSEDLQALKELHQQRDIEFAKVLSAEERQLYDYWMSNSGVATRFELGALDNPTEHDFQAIYQPKKRFEDEFENVNWSDPSVQGRYQKARDELENQIRTQLGEQRYAEYKRAGDHEYRQLLEVTQHLKLSRQTANDVYDLKKSMERRTIEIVENHNLSDEQRQQLITELRVAAGKQARTLLGNEAFEMYRRNGTTGWFEVE